MQIVLQVINAARTLAARPHSKVARENMDVFKEAWEQQLQVLTEAVDDITGIEDFLATTGGSPHSNENEQKLLSPYTNNTVSSGQVARI